MSGLLLKDFYVITKQLGIVLLFILLALINNPVIVTIGIFVCSGIPMTALVYDERSKWNEYAVMMPYTNNEIVFSKYLLGYICMACFSIVSVIGQVISIIIIKSTGMNIGMLLFGLLTGLIFMAINMPVQYKFGTEKGRYVYVMFAVLIGAAFPVIGESYWHNISDFLIQYPILIVFIAIGLNIISIMTSIFIVSSKK